MNHKQHHDPRAGVHREQRGEVQECAQEGVQAHTRRDLPEGQGDQVSVQYRPDGPAGLRCPNQLHFTISTLVLHLMYREEHLVG